MGVWEQKVSFHASYKNLKAHFQLPYHLTRLCIPAALIFQIFLTHSPTLPQGQLSFYMVKHDYYMEKNVLTA